MVENSEQADILFLHAYLFTMEGEGVGYVPDGALAVSGSKITAAGSSAEMRARFPAAEVIEAAGLALLPGLVDAHMHTSLAALRGVAQDVSHWMQKALAPYTRHLSPAAALAGTKLNVLEVLKAGTTTFGDNGGINPGWAEFYEEVGVRARLAPMINALPHGGMAGWKVGELYPFDEAGGRARIEAALAFAQDWHGAAGGRITVMLGPQAPDMLPKEQLLQMKRAAEAQGLMLHMHVAQGDREIDQMIKRYGQRTPAFLDELGFLDDQLLAIHLTEATEEEAVLIARSGARMVLCSGSIGIIDGLVPPAHAFRQAGGLCALGSDQAPGNNINNIFNEMKLTALFNKIRHRDPTVMPAWEVLRMATIEGARAIGLGEEIGSLAPGKQADLILVDLKSPNLSPVITEPVRNIVPNLVYAASGHEVKLVMVAGRILVRDGQVLTANEEEIIEEAQTQADEISRKVAEDPLHQDLALLEEMRLGNL
jgi:5-methylthioadenosine/S-adenosylhomocysteine deaminase